MQFILFYFMFLQLLFDLRSKDSEVEKYKSRLEVQYEKQYYFYYLNINHYIKKQVLFTCYYTENINVRML